MSDEPIFSMLTGKGATSSCTWVWMAEYSYWFAPNPCELCQTYPSTNGSIDGETTVVTCSCPAGCVYGYTYWGYGTVEACLSAESYSSYCSTCVSSTDGSTC